MTTSVLNTRESGSMRDDWWVWGGSGMRGVLSALAIAVGLSVPFVVVGAKMSYDAWWAVESVRRAEAEAALAWKRVIEAPALAVVPVASAAHGRDTFLSACVVCHGADAKGLPGLGRDLTQSPFVASQSDSELVGFIAKGRPNAKPVAMPARAGRADLTDSDLGDVVVYLRGLQDSRRMPELPAPIVLAAAPSESDKSRALEAAGGDAELAGYIAHGTAIFNSTCIACHGAGGAGIAGNGKMLKDNVFVQSLDDDGLLAFLKKGRDPSDPANTTGVGMPPKGGNPALSEDDLLDAIAYVRSLQGKKHAANAAK